MLDNQFENEIKRRAFAAMKHMFEEGLHFARTNADAECLDCLTEADIDERLMEISNLFLDDEFWRTSPPPTYDNTLFERD